MSARLYVPDAYFDEVCPPGRASATAWIGEAAGDRWKLDADGAGLPDVLVAPGEVVPFHWYEDLGFVEVTIAPDGAFVVHGTVPAGVTHFFVQGDPDTLADTIEGFVRGQSDIGVVDTLEVSTLPLERGQRAVPVRCDRGRSDLHQPRRPRGLPVNPEGFAMTATVPTVPLNKLKFGDDKPGGSINVRTDKRTDGLDELGASILAHGLILPLAVETIDGVAYVSDGNRRLRAMRLLVGKKKLPKDWPVKVSELDPGTGALEASLAANMFRLPLHELDQFEAFAKLVGEGMPVGDVASRFGTSERHVRQRMALGGLCPEVRAAWRDGKVSADTAQAFTVVSDRGLQADAYRSLAKGGNLYRYAVLQALGTSRDPRRLKLVGREAYLKAGGRLSEDLFDEEVHILDAELLTGLSNARLQRVCDELLFEGWAWARIRDQVERAWEYRKIKVESDYTTDEEGRLESLHALLDKPDLGLDADGLAAKRGARDGIEAIEEAAWLRTVELTCRAQTGCLVSVTADGSIEVAKGLVEPAGAAAPQRPSEGAPEEDGGD